LYYYDLIVGLVCNYRYRDGEAVWCKCGGLFWPGEVKGLASLPEEIREGFLKMPRVVVKFFDEDG
jgi:hypothetical protein